MQQDKTAYETPLALASALLLEPYQLDYHLLEKILSTMLMKPVDYADLYFQYGRYESWSLEEGQVKSGSFSISQGVGVRTTSGEKTAFAYSDDINLHALEQASAVTRAINAQGGSHLIPLQSRAISTRLYPAQDPLLSLDDQGKISMLEKLEKIARSLDTRIHEVQASLAGEYEVILVARHDGLVAADVRPLVRLSIQVIAESQGRRERGNASGGARTDYHYFDAEMIERYAQEAVNQALVNLDARPSPAGTMTVVLGSGWPGILLHEAIGHGLEGDFNRKKTSAFSNKIGQKVAASGITVVDDGTLTQRRGSLNIDDEGNTTQHNVLIENGILKGYLQDTLNSRLMGTATTGNGRRESYAHTPMPRMTNTFMLNGSYHPEEIIRSVKKGLYAANFSGGQVDITSGKFVFSAAEAWMIENGKLAYPVKGATLIGNGPEVLNRVSMVGNDMKLDSGVGTCGKEGQSVPVGVGQPSLKIEGITVGGTGN